VRAHGLLPALPRRAWIILGGAALSAVGTGMTLPFLVVYLHRVRGIELEIATLALASGPVASVGGNLVGGSLADRVGARRALMLGVAISSSGAAWLAFVADPVTAVAAAALVGLGVSISWPTQDALLAAAVEPAQRSNAFSLRYATLNGGFAIGAVAAAAIADFGSIRSFEVLYLVDAASFLAFLPILLAIGRAGDSVVLRRDRPVRGYAAVLHDRAFLAVWCLTALIVVVGYAQYVAAFPAYATGTGGISPHALGFAFAVNFLFVAVLQLVVLRLLAGRRRTSAIAGACGCFAIAWLVAIAGAHAGGQGPRAAVFAVGMAVLALGETLLAPTLSPIVNDLASEPLRGRYNGVFVLAWTTGYIVGPAIAGVGLGLGDGTPFFLLLTLGCCTASAGAIALRRSLDPSIDVVGSLRADTDRASAELA
jgi:MFS family permease